MAEIGVERAASRYGFPEAVVEDVVNGMIDSAGFDINLDDVRVEEAQLRQNVLAEDPRYPDMHRLMRDNQAELYLSLMEDGKTRWDAAFLEADFYEPAAGSKYFEGADSRDMDVEQRGGDADLLLVDVDERNMKMLELKPGQGYEGRFKKKKENWSRCFEAAKDTSGTDWSSEEPEIVMVDEITRAFERGELKGFTSLMPDLYGERGGYIVTTEEGIGKLRGSEEFKEIANNLLWDAVDPVYNDFIADNFGYPVVEPLDVEHRI